MMNLPSEITICEVGLRDGLQNEKTIVSTEDKLSLLRDLVDAGFPVIEVGSFIGMAAMVGNGVRIKDVSVQNLGIIPEAFRRLGIVVEEDGDDLWVPAQPHYEVQSFIDGTIMTLADAPWPGLTPDLLSVLLVVASQARQHHPLRPPSCRRYRHRPCPSAAGRTHDQSRHPRWYCPFDSSPECEGREPD